MNMLATIVPKSDQLNADDMIGGPMTITISKVAFKPGDEQPVSIHFEGDNNKPYKACKSMRRVIVNIWGADAKEYIGRSMTLYRDPEVLWGGQKVGGIRISHMSHLDAPVTMALTATRASRKPFTVKPLVMKDAAGGAQPPVRTNPTAAASAPAQTTVLAGGTPPLGKPGEVITARDLIGKYEAATTRDQFSELENIRGTLWPNTDSQTKRAVKAASDAAAARIESTESGGGEL